MKRKFIVVTLVGLFFLVSSISTGVKVEKINYEKNIQNIHEDYSVMRLSPEIVEEWEEAYNNAERAFIDPELVEEIQVTESYSILDLLDYIPEERNQGRCGNCWAWPSTAILAIALNVQEGIKDRLSVQFMNTCGEDYTSGPDKIECCGGGTLEMFANFYSNTNFAIPWSNTNAHWHDGGNFNCRTDCNEISKIPNYPIYDIDSEVIQTRNVPEEEAIENIKNILHQQKGVYFSIMYPDLVDLKNFQNFWRDEDENFVYDLDYYCGNEWNDEEAVGHALLIVGYNDEEGTDSDYWLVLNSWGITDNRPNGLLTWEMHIDYGCKYSNYYAFAAKTLDISFVPDPEAPEKPSITGPSSGQPKKEYTYEISAVDPQGDDVYLNIRWDSGLTGRWLGPYRSGEIIEVNHTWDEVGTYIVRAKARDMNNNISDWASFEVSMPKSKGINTPFLRFLDNNLHLFPILRHLINYEDFIE